MRWSLRVLVGLGALLLAASAAQAATIPVTTTADVVANDGVCSLREAVFAARFDANTPATLNCTPGSGDDLVQLEAAEYRLAPGGGGEDGNETGDLDTGPTSSLRIVGRGMSATVVGGAGDRIFDVAAGASLGLSDLTVRDGIVSDGANGGAVRNLGAFTALRTAFLNSAAGEGHTPVNDNDVSSPGGGGGAIWSQGQLQVADSLFSGDRAGEGSRSAVFGGTEFGPRDGGDGGAILVTAGAASLSGVTVTASRAGDGRDDIPSTVFAGGSAGVGGAVAVTGGAMTVVNSTFQGNRAGNAGSPRFGSSDEAVSGSGGAAAAEAPGSLSVTFSTFAGNAAGTGPGGTGVGSSVLGAGVGGSILADAGGACATPTPAPIANVVLPGDSSCPGAKIAGDARLGPLAANGGPTPTMLPGAGSAAINALVGVPCPGTDQRGLPRPQLGGCDAGAVEVQPTEPGAAGVGGRGGGGAAAARRVSALSLSPAVFRAAGSGGSVAAPKGKSLQAKAPIGTTVRYRLDGAARVTFTVTKPVPGRRKGKRCVAPGAAKPGAKRCVRTKKLPGSFVHQGVAGQNSFRFTGRLRGRKLAPGRYILVAHLPRPATGRAALATKAFRIVR